ncbi:MAG TPA: hypothetical protein VFR81_00460 [Longimicrobium sp.]|nr:hypothetical protein [Longimicrobium sp.]
MTLPDPPVLPEVPARLHFGGKTTEARAQVIERTARWRQVGAAKQLLWWLLVPVAALIPPHIPWVLLVLGIGGYKAAVRLMEHRTLVALHGACPKCGTEQAFSELGRMRQPHKVTCASCRWEIEAEVAHAPSVT